MTESHSSNSPDDGDAYAHLTLLAGWQPISTTTGQPSRITMGRQTPSETRRPRLATGWRIRGSRPYPMGSALYRPMRVGRPSTGPSRPRPRPPSASSRSASIGVSRWSTPPRGPILTSEFPHSTTGIPSVMQCTDSWRAGGAPTPIRQSPRSGPQSRATTASRWKNDRIHTDDIHRSRPIRA